METWTSIWDFFWFMIWVYAFFAFLTLFFSVVADLFRDRALNGWFKALWIVFLVFVPFISVLVYLISRGSGMGARGQKLATERQDDQAAYIRSLSATGPSEEISKARALLDAGTISSEEYALIKERALAG